jgi:hypothetical protein
VARFFSRKTASATCAWNVYFATAFDERLVMCGRNEPMKTIFACAVMATSLLAFTAAANAKGCIKGAIVGGIAGHFAGHGAVGAAAGCAIGHHEANKPTPPPSTTGNAPRTAPR